MSKVFVTGLDGFTGRYLARELTRAGHDVCGIVRSPGYDGAGRAHICNLLDLDELTDILALEQPQAVVHLAAIAFVQHGDVKAIYETNVLGTRGLLESLTRAEIQPQSVLLASSANVYGNAAVELVNEDVKASPANDYAVSKLAMEYAARLWQDRLPVVIARPFNYTGRGQDTRFLLPKIVDHFRRRADVIELGNLHVIRDFSDVRFVAAAYRRLIEGQFNGQIFNVCSGLGHSLTELLDIMRELTGHDPKIIANPQFVRANEVHRLIGDSTRLDSAIGTVPRIAVRDTLAWMLSA
ncbi:GDP-mannose 4,6-dehydratase [Paraburkholderia sp. A1RO-5]|uniref:NAD-dependent epimerase/dehydratase family protein n=1 Tax=Paraburkholderia sp. A1RO-5 TaxID=3028369 RepID=UPI003B76B297